MKTTHEVRHISVSIDRPPDEVFVFVSNPGNLPKWATGLGGSIKKVNGEWGEKDLRALKGLLE